MSTAIATQTTSLTPFEPTNIEQAMTLATTLSKSGLIPDSLRNKPADVLVVLMTGRELGLGPMQALRGIAVINGKPVLSADLLVAQCLRHRDVCEWFRLVESTDKAARYETKRAGSEPVAMAWTIEQANAAGLTGKGPWKAHTAAMLRARCSAALARAVYPDLVGGMYETDEGNEMRAPARVVDLAQPPQDVTPPTTPVVTVEAQPVESPPAKPDPRQPHARLWDEVCEAFGGDRDQTKSAIVTAATNLWGSSVPAKDKWTDADCAEMKSAILNPKDVPF
jgi:hypothetical protein